MTDPRGRTPGSRGPGEVADWAELTLTHRCNQRCFFCYEEGRDVAREPAMDEVHRILEDTAKRADQAVLCGKEVLLRPDVLEIIAYGKSLGLRVVSFTNGQALDSPGFIERLVEAGCDSLTISFHFPDEETFVRGARVPASGFHRQMRGLAEVGRYNREHPENPIGVSTETDMSALNVGRLSEMRQILIDHMGTTGWNMRLANLLPAHIYDIGLDLSLDSMEVRRQELREFLDTHPPELPLAFVKVALCLLPEGTQHMSLEMEYLRQGTVLTLNHQQIDAVSFDTDSVSRGRDVLGLLNQHPYRWVCRSCPMAPLCRFERVAWSYPYFLPRRALKPMPLTDTHPRQALEARAPAPAAVAHADALLLRLSQVRYPEEDLLRALGRGASTGFDLVDAWADGDPLLVARLSAFGTEVDVRFETPYRKQGTTRSLTYLLEGWNLAIESPELSLEDCRTLLESLERLPLPDLRRFDEGPLLHRETELLLKVAWARFGNRLWKGLGTLAGWTVDAIDLREDRFLDVSLVAPSGSRAVLALEARIDAACHRDTDPLSIPLRLRLVPFLEGPKPPMNRWKALLVELSTSVGLDAEEALVRMSVVGSFETPIRLEDGFWSAETPTTAGASDGASGKADSGQRLNILVTWGEAQAVQFYVAPLANQAHWFKRSEALAFWYSGELKSREAQVFARLLLAVMKHLDRVQLTESSLPLWEKTLHEILVHNRLESQYQVELSWSD